MKRLTLITLLFWIVQFAKGQDSPFARLKAQLADTPFSVQVEGRETDRMEMYGRAFHVFTNELKLWYDGKTMWHLKGDEVYVSEPDEAEFMPYQLFNPTKYGFTMTESNRKISFAKQDLQVVIRIGDNDQPVRIEVKTPDMQLDLRVKELRKCSFPSDHFKLNTTSLSNVEVVDLR